MAAGTDEAEAPAAPAQEEAPAPAVAPPAASLCIGSDDGRSEEESLPGGVAEDAVGHAASAAAIKSASQSPAPGQQPSGDLLGKVSGSPASTSGLPKLLSEQMRQLQQLQQSQTSMADMAATLPSLASLGQRGDVDADHIADQLDEVIQQHYVAQTGRPPPEGLSVPRTLRPKPVEQPLTPPAPPPPLKTTMSSARSAKGALDVEELRQDLDKIKVDTMHNMVFTVDATVKEQQVKSTFLYLTNKQAGALDVSRMPMVRSKLGIKDPKMVIRLMPSRHGTDYWNAFPYWNTSKNDGRFPCKQVPELNIEEQELTEHRMILLVKEVLLPLALEAHALVMGNETCALVAAFARVSAPLVRQLGDECPFRLLIFARAHFFHLKAEEKGAVAGAFRHQSERWSAVGKRMHEALKLRYGDDEAYWPREDLNAGEYSLVMFECLGTNKMLAQEISRNFQNDFIQSLSAYLPVIALQTYGTEKMAYVPAMADHANGGLPLFLLDSRRRAPLFEVMGPQDYDRLLAEIRDNLGQVASALRNKPGGGTTDAYTTSLIAYVKGHVTHALSVDTKSDDADATSASQKAMWLYEAIRASRNGLNRMQRQQRSKKHAILSQPTTDPEEVLLVGATDTILSYVGADIEWESKFMLQRCSDAIEDVATSQTWEEFKLKLDANWNKLRGRTFHRYRAAEDFVSVNKWCRLHDFHKDTSSGRQKLVIDLECRERPDLKEAVSKLVGLLTQEYNFSKKFDESRNTQKAIRGQDSVWMATYDLMKSKNVHVGNLHDLRRVKKDLFSLAQIERLPAKNSLESLLLLRRAWVLVDLFHANAYFYKVCSKLSYFLSLILGVTIVVVSVVTPIYPDEMDTVMAQRALLGLALVASLITGATTIVDPATKWLTLRGTALALESEIWKFRTRIGEYQGASGNGSSIGRAQAERLAEEAFHATTVRLQEMVQQSSGLKDTSFYSNTTATHVQDDDKPGMDGRKKRLRLPSWYTHGQYDGGRKMAKKTPEMDNFHSPASTGEYIKHRLVPQMKFYQKRIPHYAQQRRLFQTLALVATVVNAMLAAISDPTWTAVVSSVAGALAAWQEFHGMAKKLERYSTAVNNLSNILLWWQSLPEVDQSNTHNVEFLVERTEDLLGGERQAWLSDAQQAAKLMKEQKRKEKGEDSNSQTQV